MIRRSPQHRPIALAISSIIAVVATDSLAQPPGWGPTAAVAPPAPSPSWPARPPARIYVVPFPMDPGLEQELAQASASGLPQGPIRRMLADRPRATDMVTGFDRQAPVGMSIAQQVADGLFRAGLPAVFWNSTAPPPPDGWQLHGEIVGLNEGNAAARTVVGFGAGNKTIGVDVAIADPLIAGGRPFFLLDTSDKGRMAPGTVAVGAVAGFNPYVMVGKSVAANSGLSDITQQSRIAGEIVNSVTEALRQHGQWQPR